MFTAKDYCKECNNVTKITRFKTSNDHETLLLIALTIIISEAMGLVLLYLIKK